MNNRKEHPGDDRRPRSSAAGPVVPVICDRCRVTGIAGEADFSHLGDLLEFEPVPVRPRVNGWDPEAQRAFIAALAVTGSKRRAALSIGRNAFGIEQLLKRPDSDSFKAAVERAMAIAAQNGSMKIAQGVADAAARNAQLTPPSRLRGLPAPAPGQVMNENGEWEDEESYRRRADEAKDSIGEKLRRARRLFLYDISACPAKRAAFEILAEWPVDWEIAARGLPQPDEPWHRTNLREPDMLLTAEAGFLGAPLVHGPDRRAELLAEINNWRVEQGLDPVEWDEASLPSPPSGGEGGSRSEPGEGDYRQQGEGQ